MNLTFVVGFRDMDCERVKRSLDSLLVQSCREFYMVFIDYGSKKEISSSIQALLRNYAFVKYYYSDTRGWLWNRSKALNTGARLAESKYIFFTDIDIVYEKSFVEEALKQMSEAVFLISDTQRVPQGFTDWAQIIDGQGKHSFNSMRGRGIACFTKSIFEAIGGFNENYSYWGAEDNDLAHRMSRYGLKEIFSERLLSYHQWHPRSSTSIPYSLLLNNAAQYHRQLSDETVLSNRDQPWGKLISSLDRPVYQYVDPDKKEILISEGAIFREAYDIAGIHKWLTELEAVEDTAFVFSQNAVDGQLTVFLNKVLRRLNWRLDRQITHLHDFALGLSLLVPGLFRDYFLGCSINKRNYSVFMK